MPASYVLSPSVGVARLGNSTTDIYLAPSVIGGLPLECDANGNATGQPFSTFKDVEGRVKRQAQRFSILRTTDGGVSYQEITLQTPGVTSIEWQVHLANKKAAWYQFSELQGNLLLGPDNSYAIQGVPLRNSDTTDEAARQLLIIDPGPRSLINANQSVEVSRDNIPVDYPHGSFPNPTPLYGWAVNSLGTLKTDSLGRLLVIGAYGRAGGDEIITGYGGADTWYDDTADGPVYCVLTIDGVRISLSGWVICASPDFAPEIVNISNLDDTMFDVAVRCFDLVPGMYSGGTWNTAYKANYQRDILPLIQRISRYQWVANVQAMNAFCSYIFDFSDPSPENAANRQQYFAYFREPTVYTTSGGIEGQSATLFAPDGVPMMPLNSGSNSVKEVNIEKFLALNQTQHFLLSQWAAGEFVNNPVYTPYPVVPSLRVPPGNCVGLPMCPGIEVTWTMQNPSIYLQPYVIRQAGNEADYQANGLTPSRDETEGGGCQPGDLSKRMAIPWQADFFNCTVQYINFTDPDTNKEEGVPLPPTYYTYWWPPQSPWDVLTGDLTVESQALAHTPAGLQVNYARGINSYGQMITEWSYLGFIRNQNRSATSANFPYLVETERLHGMFAYKEVPVGDISGNPDDDETTIPVWYSMPAQKLSRRHAASLKARADKDLFNEIVTADSLRHVLPRRGSRARV